ncbi:Eukaryotic translation initiation factor 4E-1A-like, protein [Aphelenchoides fujianensis]|nr:Eukaryotic translation initiation factor 4E-1A-like, protein [Aphelenchoides fujianensis]
MESPENQNHLEEENAEKTLPEINEDSVAISPDSVLHKSLPLKYRWKFWYLDGDKQKDWMHRLHDLCVLSTVEDFWALIDRIRKPSNLPQCDYSLFKEAIPPVWEEPDNKSGGRIVYQVPNIWTQSGADPEVIKQIGTLMRDLWASHYDSMDKARIFYESHADTQVKQSSVTPHRMYITGNNDNSFQPQFNN